MKRLLIFLLCAATVLSSLSFAAAAVETALPDETAEAVEPANDAVAEEATESVPATEPATEAAADLKSTDQEIAAVGADAEDTAPTGYTLLDESAFQVKLNALQVKYPNNSIWEGVYYEDGAAKAWTCFAYAAQMMYEIFGARYIADGLYNLIDYNRSNITKLNAGDIVRIDGDSHSIFITKVTSTGYYFTDGNGTGVYNQVRWNGFYSLTEMQNRFTYRVHLPNNNLKGTGITHTVAYAANHGTGSTSTQTVAPGEEFTLKSGVFTREEYLMTGYAVKRSSDNKWFTTDAKWQLQSDIVSKGYHYYIYPEGGKYTLNSTWLGNVQEPVTFTFYAQWKQAKATLEYLPNGGSGSTAAQSVAKNESFTLKSNVFTRADHSFAGYIVNRSFDNTWFTVEAGWQPQSDIIRNGYRYKLYQQGSSYTLNSYWMGDGATSETTFSFSAQWLPDKSKVEFLSNYSGFNYLPGSGLGSGYEKYIYSRNTSVYAVSVDRTERLNNANSLKIVGKSAGSAGKDLALITTTNLGYGNGYSQAAPMGDDKNLYLHFYAKAGVDGAKMYVRWGYSSDYISVALTKNWKAYSVCVPKNRFFSYALHPYFDKATTYYLNSLVLGDSAGTSNITPETGGWACEECYVTRGSAIADLPVPQRNGWEFLGWYTAAEGGTQVTSSTKINESALRLYAHWRKAVSDTPVDTVRSNGHIYELYDNTMSWNDAAQFCAEKGGHLITVGSPEENQIAYGLVSGRQGYCWTGLRYLKNSGTWEWVDNTSLSDYCNWFDSSFGANDTGAHFGTMYAMDFADKYLGGSWGKVSGVNSFASYYGYQNSCFICEYDDPVLLGDADGNGTVGTIDATVVQRFEIGLDTGVSGNTLIRGDVDGNNVVDVIDATFIQRYAALMETPYAIGEWIRT